MSEQSEERRITGAVARSGSLNLAGSAIAALSGLLLTWIVARGVSQDDAGRFFAITSLFVILAGIAEMGGDAALPRFVPYLRAQGRHGELGNLLRLATLLTLAAGLVLGIGLVVVAFAIDLDLGVDPSSGGYPLLLVGLAIAIPFAALGNVLLAATRAFFSIRPTVVLEKLAKNVLQLLLVGAGVLAASVSGMVVGWVAPLVLLCIPAAWWVVRILRTAWRQTPNEDRRKGIGVPGYLDYTWPRALSRLLAIVLQRADIVVVAALLSVREAALYAVASRLIVLGQFAASSIQQVLAPQIAHLIERHTWVSTMRVAKLSAAWTMLLVWPLYLLSISAGPMLLTILGGEDYTAAAPALAILAVGMLVASATGPVDTVLLMAGRSSASLFNMMVAVAVNLSLLFLLIPRWGIAGAAVAWSAALVVRALLGVVMVRLMTGLTAFGRPGFIAAACAIVAYLGIPLVMGRGALEWGGGSLLIVVIASSSYAALVWAFRRPLSIESFRGLRRGNTESVEGT